MASCAAAAVLHRLCTLLHDHMAPCTNLLKHQGTPNTLLQGTFGMYTAKHHATVWSVSHVSYACTAQQTRKYQDMGSSFDGYDVANR